MASDVTDGAINGSDRGRPLSEGIKDLIALAVALGAGFALGLPGIVLGAVGALAAALIWWRQAAHADGSPVDPAVRAVLTSDPVPGAITDEDGLIVTQNAEAERTLRARTGLPMSDLFLTNLADLRGYVTALCRQAAEEGFAAGTITRGQDRMRLSARPVTGGLLWRMERLGPANAVPEGLAVVSLGRQGVILSMNQAARDLVGQRARRVDQLVADPPIAEARVYKVITANGPRPCHISLLDDGPGRREIALLPAERAPSAEGAGIDDLPIALLKVTPEGRIVSATREARSLFNAEAVEGEALARYMEGLGRSIADWLGDAAAGKGLQRSEFLRLARDDREIFVQVTLSRITEGGRCLLVAVLNDATELKTLEAQFVQSQKMQAIGQLAGGVAHDFNNLLTAISGHCDLMLLRHDPGDPDYGDLIQINQNANRAAGLVGQLLAFSRKQTLRPEVLDLRETLADLTHLLNRLVGEKTTLTLRHDPALPPIRGDRRQLEQVMMNLVVNARDAMPEGGEIRVETERCELTAPLERDRAVVAPGAYVVVKVTDSGIGIPSDKRQKVFEPFFTTKRPGEGTGLGLSTVYGIIKQTGGFIFVDSVVGEGTTFSLYFPVYDKQPEAPPPPVTAAPRTVQRKHDGVILLVEDEAPVRAFASRALRLRGYTVIEADSAEAALEILADDAVEVDLFVSDVIMPGLDGPTWVKRARETRPDVGVVFVSGYAEEALERTGSDMANIAFLPKPFSLNALTEIVQAQLN